MNANKKKIRRRLRVATGPSVGRRASIDNLSDSSITRFFPSPFQLRLIKIHYEKTRAKGHNEWERFFLFDFFFLVNQDTIIDNPFEPLITRRFVSLLHFFSVIYLRPNGGWQWSTIDTNEGNKRTRLDMNQKGKKNSMSVSVTESVLNDSGNVRDECIVGILIGKTSARPLGHHGG